MVDVFSKEKVYGDVWSRHDGNVRFDCSPSSIINRAFPQLSTFTMDSPNSLMTKFHHIYSLINNSIKQTFGLSTPKPKSAKPAKIKHKVTKKLYKRIIAPKTMNDKEKEDDRVKEMERKVDWLIKERMVQVVDKSLYSLNPGFVLGLSPSIGRGVIRSDVDAAVNTAADATVDAAVDAAADAAADAAVDAAVNTAADATVNTAVNTGMGANMISESNINSTVQTGGNRMDSGSNIGTADQDHSTPAKVNMSTSTSTETLYTPRLFLTPEILKSTKHSLLSPIPTQQPQTLSEQLKTIILKPVVYKEPKRILDFNDKLLEDLKNKFKNVCKDEDIVEDNILEWSDSESLKGVL
jgi:hypothetical protein